jgi:hypothetical protein
MPADSVHGGVHRKRGAVDTAVDRCVCLKEALDANSDPGEKGCIQKAIDYLQLPSLSEREGAAGGFEPTTS